MPPKLELRILKYMCFRSAVVGVPNPLALPQASEAGNLSRSAGTLVVVAVKMKVQATKSDEFSEKCQRGGGGRLESKNSF